MLTAREFARKIILDVIETTGITWATAGIGTNLSFPCKVLMDTKHIPAETKTGCIAQLDEMTYRQTMWSAPQPSSP